MWSLNVRAVCAAVGLLALWLTVLAPVARAGGIEKSFERTLPESLPWPFDLRLVDRETVIVAAGRDGIFSLDLSDGESSPHQLVAAEEVTYANRLGASDEWLVAAAPFGPVGWISRAGEGTYREDAPMSVILDLDVAGDKVWILGSRRDEAGEFAPEGAILWSGELVDGELVDLESRMFAESGAGAEEMARCYILETGAVRSLGKDRWVVVPGVQPGVFLYDGSGKLLRAWQSQDLGFTDECALEHEEFLAVNGELEPRNAWLNRRRVLDDLVVWRGQPGLVIRDVTPDGPRWRLTLLGDEGPRRLPLPGARGGPNARGRADVSGDRLVLLLTEYERTPEDRKAPPKLMVYELGAP